MKIPMVRFRVSDLLRAAVYLVLLGSGVTVMVLAIPLAIRFFHDDPLAATVVFVAAIGWIVSFRAFHNLSR